MSMRAHRVRSQDAVADATANDDDRELLALSPVDVTAYVDRRPPYRPTPAKPPHEGVRVPTAAEREVQAPVGPLVLALGGWYPWAFRLPTAKGELRACATSRR